MTEDTFGASRATVILNPNAGSAERATRLLFENAEAHGWEVHRTGAPGDGERMARRAVEAGAECVVAAGGDGTVAEVINGLMDHEDRPPLAILPLGTGNDFARTAGMPLDLEVAFAHLVSGQARTRRLDLLEVRADGERRLCMNSVNGGIGYRIAEELEAEQKKRWGPLAFTIAALRSVGSLPSWDVHLELDGEPIHVTEVASVVAANGPTVAGGLPCAPGADLEDGQLDLVIVSGARLRELLGAAVRAKLTDPFDQGEHVRRWTGRRLRVRVPEDFGFSVDGEPLAAGEVGDTVAIETLPRALPVRLGPDYERGHFPER